MMNRFLSFLVGGFFFFISGCSVNPSDESTQPSAAISIYALSPETSSLNIFLNDANIATGVPFGSYTLYNQVAAGNTRLKVQTNSLDRVQEAQLTTTAGQYYSVFLIDEDSTHLTSLLVNDNINKSPDDSVHVRFFNFSPDAPAVDLSSYSDSSNHKTIWKNRIYNRLPPVDSINTFTTIKTGTYNFYAIRSGTLHDTLARFTGKNLGTAGNYTLVLEGKYKSLSGDTTLQLGIRKH